MYSLLASESCCSLSAIEFTVRLSAAVSVLISRFNFFTELAAFFLAEINSCAVLSFDREAAACFFAASNSAWVLIMMLPSQRYRVCY